MPKISQLRAQMITQNAQGKKIKRSLNGLRTDIADDELKASVEAIVTLLDHEKLAAVNLTAHAALNV